MTLEDLELAASVMAQRATHHGYGFADVPMGRVRVRAIRETGRFSYFLNHVSANRRRVERAMQGSAE